MTSFGAIEDVGRVTNVLDEVLSERERQETLKAAGKFLWSCADNEALRNKVLRAVTEPEKFTVLGEEFGEIAKELVEQIIALDRGDGERSLACLVRARKELIQVAAVCVAWVESLDARGIK